MADELIGRSLGRYEITALIGHGGMATVYRATYARLHQTVAVKVLHAHLADDPELLGRFEREAQAVAALRHPNIVRVLDFDCIDERYFMVMEYVDGPTLAARLGEVSGRGGRLPAAEVLRLFEPLCAAVDYACGEGMVHRDIKPANVLLTARDEPVLSDYGIARIMALTRQTATGTVMGSAHYMSPEQALGKPADARSDLYALGVMLFEALAGLLPYDADSLPAVLLMQVSAPVPAVCALNPWLPASLDDLLRRALAKDPEERFQTGAALATALRDGLGQLLAESDAAVVTAPSSEQPSPDPTRVEAPAPAATPVTTVDTPRRSAATEAKAKTGELRPGASQPEHPSGRPAPVPKAPPPRAAAGPLPASRRRRRTVWLAAIAVLAVVAVATLFLVAPLFRDPGSNQSPTLPRSTASPPSASSGTRQSAGADQQVLDGIDKLQVGVITWATNNNNLFPTSADVTEAGGVATYVNPWPTNPYTGQPMKPGPQPGDYTYEQLNGGAGYMLTGYISNGLTYTVP